MKKMMLLIAGLLLFLPFIGPQQSSAEAESKNIFYYIIVDRFQNGSSEGDEINLEDPLGFRGGDFQGIMNRINHLDTIGVTHVILSPIFESDSIFGDNANYQMIQPTYGTEQELNQLITSLNERQIEVLMHFPIDIDSILTNDVEEARSNVFESIQYWLDHVPFSGVYVTYIDGLPMDFWEDMKEVVGDRLLVADVVQEYVVASELLNVGFDKVIDTSFREPAVNIFSQTNEPLDPLMELDHLFNQNMIYYFDHYLTDRFAVDVANKGYHPITHWKQALTLLMTLNNDMLIYQGSEMPLGGVAEDYSNLEMVNFLTGDDQLIKHMEKISNAIDDRPSLAMGDLSVLHAEDSYLVFERTYEDESTIVAINLSDSMRRVDVELDQGLELRGLLINDLVRENEDGTYTIAVEREASNIFVVQQDQGIFWPMVLIFLGVMSVFVIFTIVMYRKNRKEQ